MLLATLLGVLLYVQLGRRMRRRWVVRLRDEHPYRSVARTSIYVPPLAWLVVISSITLAVGAVVVIVSLARALDDGPAVGVLVVAVVDVLQAWFGIRLGLRSLSRAAANSLVQVGIATIALLVGTVVLHADARTCQASVASAVDLATLACVHTMSVALTTDFLRLPPEDFP